MRTRVSISSDFGRNNLLTSPHRPFAASLATHNGKFFSVMTTKGRILVVDDQMAVAAMIRFLLTRAGCETQGALDAKTALRLAQTQVFDLITIDFEMPGLNGFELFKRLKEIPHLVETPIVFVAGNASIENQQSGLDLGAADFIEKPFDTQDFISRILSLVEETAMA
jgi:DNA-binding response OmpR family regulator